MLARIAGWWLWHMDEFHHGAFIACLVNAGIVALIGYFGLAWPVAVTALLSCAVYTWIGARR